MYDVRLASSRVAKELEDLPSAVYERAEVAIQSLRRDPRPRSCVKLVGSPLGDYRMRVGSHRIVYDTYDDHNEVVILRIARRGSAYR